MDDTRQNEREETWGLKDYSRGEPEKPVSVDIVCGMNVDENAAPGGHSRYAGQTYYFCSDFCRKNFEQDPGKYIGQRTQP